MANLEVLALDTAVPQIRAPGAGDGYSVPRDMTMASGTTLAAQAVTSTSLGTSGNLTFSSTAQRITGDMSNATVSNRLAFQNSTTNGNTSVYALPNGTATAAQYVIVNNSDPTNASTAQLFINNTETRLISTITGTGTYLPMTFLTGGSERMRIDTSGNVGIGTTPAAAHDKFTIGGTMPTAGGYSLGYLNRGVIPTGTTVQVAGYVSNMSTQAASFTVADWYHFQVNAPTLGAGSAITNQYGYFAPNLTGATNNYGFYSNIASGSNRWNFYAAGTAENYFAGKVGIGAAPTCSLLVFTGNTTDGIRIQRFAGNYYSELRQTDAQEGLAFLVGDGSTVAERLRIKGTGQTRFQPRSGNPGGAEAGDVYYDSSDNKLKVYNGTSWVDLH